MEIVVLPFILVGILLPIILMIMILVGDGSALHKLLWVLVIWFVPCLGIILWLILGEETKNLGER